MILLSNSGKKSKESEWTIGLVLKRAIELEALKMGVVLELIRSLLLALHAAALLQSIVISL